MINQSPTGDPATDRALTAIEARLEPHLVAYVEALTEMLPGVPAEARMSIHSLLADAHKRLAAIHANAGWRAQYHGLNVTQYRRAAT